MTTARQRFLRLLRDDILQVDAADLDFGIYRVLNHRRAEIERFLTEGLPARIDSALVSLPGTDATTNTATEDEQARIYNALYTFFARYYDDGDFLPRARRGRAGAYTVAYDGSDTFFHWATKGSHYAKSGERFASYAYTQPGGQRVRLTVVQADVERDNAKGAKRWYLPAGITPPAAGQAGEWRVGFSHRPLADDETTRYGAVKPRRGAGPSALDPAADDSTDNDADSNAAPAGKDVQARILSAWLADPAALPAGLDATLLARHALRYVRGQSADFFVHPQLGAFLRAELDDFLKAEFINLWDLPAGALGRERGKLLVCRELGLALISVLASLEDLQARLFEKRKFVLQAHYLVQCAWLAALGEAGAALVARAAAHPAQVQRWRDWVGAAADTPPPDGQSLLARYPHLPLDTGLFDDELAAAVLACVPDITAATGGVLVHGDNYAALRTLEPPYRQAVKCIYIDPPYNTGGDGFLYKDGYQQSTWQTMLQGLLENSTRLLSGAGVFLASIDEPHRTGLAALCDDTFGIDGRLSSLIWKGATDNNPTRIAVEHEHVLCYANAIDELEEVWSSTTSESKELLLSEFDRICTTTKSLSKRQVLFDTFASQQRDVIGDLHRYRRVDANGPYAARRNMENPGKPGYQYDVLHPVTGKACSKPYWGWRFPEATMQGFLASDRLIFGDDETKIPELKVYLRDVKFPLRSVIQMDARKGSNDLDRLFGSRDVFKNPKPAELLEKFLPFAAKPGTLVVDYFAGSGTTAHAVINLNRADGGQRRFILVEQGEYFDTVTLPRVAKVMTAPDWKDGRPKADVQHDATASDEPEAHWSRRTLPIVQVLRLERYEDSLDALALPAQADAAGGGQTELAGLDHVLRYLADTTTPDNPVRLSTAQLASPFNYRLPTVWEGRAIERPVDLLHTTLLLLGLHLVRLRRLQRTATPAAPLACPGDACTVLLAEVRPHRPGLPAASVPLELLVLRDHDTELMDVAQRAAAAQAECDWLQQTVPAVLGRTLASYARIRHNRDLALTGEGERPESIDTALAQAMWVRDPAFSPAGA